MVIRKQSSKPFWQLRVFLAPALILMGHPDNLLLVSALPEHLLCPLLVEGAAHASVSGLHGEDRRAADAPALPHALLYHSCKFKVKVFFMLMQSSDRLAHAFLTCGLL